MKEIFEVTSTITNITFRIKLVLRGERHGLRDCLVHDQDDPLVEFFDSRYDNSKFALGLGQFISSYYLTTLLGLSQFGPGQHQRGLGLDLQGGVPDWRVDGRSMNQVLVWAIKTIAAKASATLDAGVKTAEAGLHEESDGCQEKLRFGP